MKLNDREEVTGVFRGAPYTFRRHWANQRSTECIGEDCPICKADPENRPSFRFRINFITSKEGEWSAKILEGGGEFYDSLVNLDKKFDLSKTPVEITRRGLKQNTKYDALPLVQQPLTKDVLAKVNAVPLLPLSAQEADGGSES